MVKHVHRGKARSPQPSTGSCSSAAAGRFNCFAEAFLAAAAFSLLFFWPGGPPSSVFWLAFAFGFNFSFSLGVGLASSSCSWVWRSRGKFVLTDAPDMMWQRFNLPVFSSNKNIPNKARWSKLLVFWCFLWPCGSIRLYPWSPLLDLILLSVLLCLWLLALLVAQIPAGETYNQKRSRVKNVFRYVWHVLADRVLQSHLACALCL